MEKNDFSLSHSDFGSKRASRRRGRGSTGVLQRTSRSRWRTQAECALIGDWNEESAGDRQIDALRGGLFEP